MNSGSKEADDKKTDSTMLPEEVKKQKSLDAPDWNFWRRRGYCRIWQATLLTLNIEPSKANRLRLKDTDRQTFIEYLKRREIIVVNCGHHSELPVVEHERAGKSGAEKYIELTDLLKFSKIQKWTGTDAFTKGILEPSDDTQNSNFEEFNTDEEEVSELDMRKGDGYEAARFGALLLVLEAWIRNEIKLPSASYLRASSLNYSQIGRDIEKMIKIKNGGFAPKLFKAETNARTLAKSVKLLMARF